MSEGERVLRTVEAVEQRPWLLFAIVFFATAFLGFVVQALGNVYLSWRSDPLVSQYRATLSYTSAIVGDGILIPLVNVFMTSQLALWRRRPNVREVAGPIMGGALVTAFVHLYQATQDLRNWTMTKPWDWTPLGYYHAVFMWAEISFVLFFWGQLALIAKEHPRAILSYRVGLMFVCGALFLRLLFADYGYIN
ncbi:MAG TPA: hypothetical protein VFM06_03605 [Candidatus Limnocylindria bacterium]|nr:hypothetical protein [Candidatus Limnocylindria bacterium]